MRVQAIDYVRETIGEEIRAVCADKSSHEAGLLTYNVDLSATVLAIWNKIYSEVCRGASLSMELTRRFSS